MQFWRCSITVTSYTADPKKAVKIAVKHILHANTLIVDASNDKVLRRFRVKRG